MVTISAERSLLKKVGQVLISRETWGARFKNYADMSGRATITPARLVFIHITITNPKNYASDEAHIRAVEAIGISRFPQTGMSYNRLFTQSGKGFEGQPMGRRGAHTVNNKNITRCVTSGCPARGGSIPSATTNLNTVVRAYAICQNVNDTVTDDQLEEMAQAIAADQLAGLVIRGAPIHGHRCVAFKDCPAAKMWARMQELETRVEYLVAHGIGIQLPDVPPSTTQPDNDEVFDMGVTEEEFSAAIDKNDQKWVRSREHWDSQAWVYQAVAIATAMRVLDGKPSPSKTEVDAAMAAARGVMAPLENSFG